MKLAVLCCSFAMVFNAVAETVSYGFIASSETEWNNLIDGYKKDGWSFNSIAYNTASSYAHGAQINANGDYIISPTFPSPIISISITGAGSGTSNLKLLDASGNELCTSGTPFSEIAMAFNESDNLTSFKIQRVASKGTSVIYNITIIFASAPETPANFTATTTSSQITLTWDAVTGASYYNLSYSINGGESTEIANLTTTSYTLSDLAIGNYTFAVSAVNASGFGSTAATTTCDIKPATPTLTIGEVGSAGFALSWSAVSDATYTVYLNGEVYKSGLNATSTTIDGLQAGSYNVSVSATVNGVESEKSATASVTIEACEELVAPTLFDIEDASYSGFTANWSAVGGEGTTYTLTVLRNDETYKTYSDLSSCSQFVETTLLGSYTVMVTATNDGTTTEPSESKTLALTLSAPDSVAIASANTSALNISWGQCYDFAGNAIVPASFVVKVEKDETGEGEFTTLAEQIVTESPLEVATGGTGVYRVQVAAQILNTSGVTLSGEFSEPIVKTIALSTPELATLTMDDYTETSFVVKWGAVEGAVAYDIVISPSDDLSVTPVTNRTTELSFAMNDLESESWSWSVRAVADNENFNSAFTKVTSLDLSSYLASVPAIKMSVESGDVGVYSNDFETPWPGEYKIWGDARTLPAWYAIKNGVPVTEYITDDGGSSVTTSFMRLHNSKAHYSIGVHPAATSFAVGLALTNDSPYAVKTLEISYTAAQYRLYTSGVAEFKFSCLIGGDSIKALTDTDAWSSEQVIVPENMDFATQDKGSAAACYIPQSFSSKLSLALGEFKPGKVLQLRWDAPEQGEKTTSRIPKIGIDCVVVKWTFDRPKGTLMLLR